MSIKLATNQKDTGRLIVLQQENSRKIYPYHYCKDVTVKVCLTFKLRTGRSPISIPGNEARNRLIEAKL
jgi:hypothetical protein